jgi:SWI/SNF-related matrix-associated actin-dependent regulator of chromatin subfamily A3
VCYLTKPPFSVLVGFVFLLLFAGVAHAGEYVTLVREPNNPYDRNAIRVDNMSGEKVGHIKRQQASILAPIMDRYCNSSSNDQPSSSLIVEATIVSQNSYTLPCLVEFFAQENRPEEQEGEDRNNTDELLHEQAMTLSTMLHQAFGHQQHGFRINYAPHPEFRTAESSSSKKKKKKRSKKDDTTTCVSGSSPEPPTVVNTTIDWTQQAKQLDEMFDVVSEQQLSNLAPVEVPSTLKTRLLDYQYQGLQWMVRQELPKDDDEATIPFYVRKEEKGRQVYHCTITNSSQSYKPKTFRGGILADEMVNTIVSVTVVIVVVVVVVVVIVRNEL